MRAGRIAASLLVVVLCVWGGVVVAVVLYGRRDEARPADAVVVLGAAQYAGRPSPVLRARLDHAIELYHADLVPYLILTGGVGVRDTVSEAEVGKRYAMRAGVPSQRILIERSGVSSDESMRTVRRLMEAKQLHTAVLVSDPFHMLRLHILATRLGIRAYSSPTRTSPIRLDSASGWKFVLRESLIVPVTFILGA
jgi:uncharacterized SAM-binding protein YcdF (DUF218 family)